MGRNSLGRLDSAKLYAIEKASAAMSDETISHDQAREAAQRLINSHFRLEPCARIGIPAGPGYDDDLVVCAYIEQQRQSDAALQAAIRERDEARAEVERLRRSALPDYPVRPLRMALSYAGIATPPSDETLWLGWAEHAQMLIRWAAAKADASLRDAPDAPASRTTCPDEARGEGDD